VEWSFLKEAVYGIKENMVIGSQIENKQCALSRAKGLIDWGQEMKQWGTMEGRCLSQLGLP
jgi:hypothetical protein